MTASISPHLPSVAVALNRLLTTVRWEDEQGRLRDLDNNVSLARAVSAVRGPTPHTYIHKIRQGSITDPRVSVIWALCVVLNQRTPPGVTVTPDYFFVPETKAGVDHALDLHLDGLVAGRGHSGSVR